MATAFAVSRVQHFHKCVVSSAHRLRCAAVLCVLIGFVYMVRLFPFVAVILCALFC